MNPHMTGHDEPETRGETRSASELLNDDGTVDTSAVMSIAKRDNSTAEASEIRRRLLQGETRAEVADDLGRGQGTICNHAHGAVDYVGGEPECPPVEYVDGQWQVVDDE